MEDITGELGLERIRILPERMNSPDGDAQARSMADAVARRSYGKLVAWAARAELLAKTGAHAEARHAYQIAIGLERDPAVRRFLQGRHSALPA
jgi:predicted RNA polymerase sigma factor